ncbi:MAG: hypothetical protein IKN53_00950 [Oscillibacter sp.]|nr:hypothetical protein [Oscillibacter sp.]
MEFSKATGGRRSFFPKEWSELLIVWRIEIENFENIGRLALELDPDLAVLPAPYGAAIVRAIGVVLGSEFLSEGAEKENRGAVIRAVAGAMREPCSVTVRITSAGVSRTATYCRVLPFPYFLDRIRQSAEEERLCRFVYDKNERFSDLLRRYRDAETFYPQGGFSKLTRGIGDTRNFRACLKEFIRESKAQIPPFKRSWRLGLEEDGTFRITDRDGAQVALNEKQDELFEYLCFLEVNSFWQEVESVRDFCHVRWPLFLSALPSAGEAYRNAALTLERQVILCEGKIERIENNL